MYTTVLLSCDLLELRGSSRCFILFVHIINMDNEDIDAMNTDMDHLNLCLNEYAKENDDPADNPLTVILAYSQYWDLNNLIQHCQSKQTIIHIKPKYFI